MSLAEGVLGYLNAMIYGIMIMGAGLVVNLCQLASLLVLPFDRHLHRKINSWLGSGFLKTGSYLLENWGGCPVSTYGTQVPEGVSALCLVNHSSDVDWAAGLSYFARRGDPFPGGAKAIAKDGLKFIPVFGWLVYGLEYMFVKRNWEQDQVSLAAQAKSLCESREPFWIVLFPEGTRKTPKKLAQSQEYCKKNGQPVLKHVLFPRFKAYTLVLKHMRERLDGIVDATISFDDEVPNMPQVLMRRGKTRVRIYTRYYPMSEIPETEKEQEEWLAKRWMERDAILEQITNDREAFISKHKDHFFPEDPADYSRMFGLIIAFFVLAAFTTVLMVMSKVVFRIVAVTTAAFWLSVMVALVINIRPSKVGEKKNVSPGTESTLKKAQ